MQCNVAVNCKLFVVVSGMIKTYFVIRPELFKQSFKHKVLKVGSMSPPLAKVKKE